MKNKKATVLVKTNGLLNKSLQIHSKPSDAETQPTFGFDKTKKIATPKIIRNIYCFESKERAILDGYRFRLVSLSQPCRTTRVLEITGNRFERRQAR